MGCRVSICIPYTLIHDGRLLTCASQTKMLIETHRYFEVHDRMISQRICYFNPAGEGRPTGGQMLASGARSWSYSGGSGPCEQAAAVSLLLLFDSGCCSSGKTDAVTGEIENKQIVGGISEL